MPASRRAAASAPVCAESTAKYTPYRRYMSHPAGSTSLGRTNAGNRPVARRHTGHADGRANAGKCAASARTRRSQAVLLTRVEGF